MATIRDVAEAAGVSVATVSRVLNGTAPVADSTRLRVEQAVARFDFWPHAAARSLTTSRTHTLGILLPDLHGQFFSEIIRGIDQGARETGFQILVSSSHADAGALMLGARAMSGRVDGLVAMAPDRDTTTVIARLSRKFPVVLLNPHHPIEVCATIAVANFDGAVAMVKHLLARGHRSIGMVTGPLGNMDAEERWRGYRHALKEAGIAPQARLQFQGDFTESSGFRAGLAIAALSRPPAAVFAANDGMAVGLLSAFRQQGIEVPGRIAVAGFDDIPIAEFVVPRLTTVHVDAFALGLRAVKMLTAFIRRSPAGPPPHQKLPVRLVVRQSCGAKRESVSAKRPAAVRPRRADALSRGGFSS
jgi:LacI family transcriptional regulator